MSHRLFSSPLQVLVLRDYKTHYVCSRTHTHSLQNKRWKGKQHKLCWQQADTSDCRSVSESLSADTLTLTQHDCEQVQAQGMTQIQSACQESNHRLTAQQRETRGGEGRRTGEKGRDDWVNTSTSQQETRVRQLTSLFTGQIYDRLVKELTVFSCHICSWHVKRIELMLKRCLMTNYSAPSARETTEHVINDVSITETAQPETTVQDHVSTLVRVKSLHIFL